MLGFLMDADRDALARYLDGDEKAFEELVVRYEASVRRVASGIVHDHALAEDIAQETFLTAYEKAGSYRGDGTVRSWLMSIAVRRALDELRRRSRQAAIPLTELNEPTGTPHSPLEASWELRRALALLTADSRAALVLREIEGSTYREIADALRWPMGTVATKLHRARMELRCVLAETKDAVPKN